MAKSSTNAAPTRAQKQEATRQKLLDAAARQVGLHGYAGASIHKITTLADIANGTFYNYFASQQDLFDQLLPELGNNLLEEIREAIKGERDSVRREELGFRAFFDYLTAHPYFYRVLNEAEAYAPRAYRAHMDNVAGSYLRALKQAAAKGELGAYSERELEVIVYILLSARNYLGYRYCIPGGKPGRLPDWVTRAYMKFVSDGISGGTDGGAHRTRLERAPAMAEPIAREAAGDGWARLTLTVSDQHLDGFGYVERGAIVSLAERASAEAVLPGADAPPRAASLTTSFVRASHARTLVAEARRSNVGGGLAHASVEIREHSGDGALVATCLIVLAVEAATATAQRAAPTG